MEELKQSKQRMAPVNKPVKRIVKPEPAPAHAPVSVSTASEAKEEFHASQARNLLQKVAKHKKQPRKRVTHGAASDSDHEHGHFDDFEWASEKEKRELRLQLANSLKTYHEEQARKMEAGPNDAGELSGSVAARLHKAEAERELVKRPSLDRSAPKPRGRPVSLEHGQAGANSVAQQPKAKLSSSSAGRATAAQHVSFRIINIDS